MLLSRLMDGIPFRCDAFQDREITAVSSDLRQVEADSLFVAIRGRKTDTHTLLQSAADRGACVVLTEYPVSVSGACDLVVEDTRRALAAIWSNFYGRPSEKLILTGITGTNGKTTVSHMLDHCLRSVGVEPALIGTVENRIGARRERASFTTPEPQALYSLLAQTASSGIRNVIMEASSHALDQERLYGLQFRVGVFTNLSVEHLDYHGTMRRYLDAKLKLFQQSDRRVVNLDSDYSRPFAAFSDAVGFSAVNDAPFCAKEISERKDGVRYTLHSPDGKVSVYVPMSGFFTVYNSLAALASAYCLGYDISACAASLAWFGGVRGRMEYVQTERPFDVLIDFAHTPDGLQNLLDAVRPTVRGRLILVFGCGGDRDRTKRPLMGQVAATNADVAVVTSDNPRSEDPQAIIDDILAGVGEKQCLSVVDRTAAIRCALRMARAGDVVVLAGKGHEDYQIINGKTVHYDERELIRDLLKEL